MAAVPGVVVQGVGIRAWRSLEPTGRTMRIDEVYLVRFAGDSITGMQGLEDTWTRMRQLAGAHATLGELGSLG